MTNTEEKLTAEKVDEIRAKEIRFDDISELMEADFSKGYFKYLKSIKKSMGYKNNDFRRN